MFCKIIVFSVLVAVSFSNVVPPTTKHLDESGAHGNEIFRKCSAEYNITEEQFENLENDVWANRTSLPNMKCFLNCMLTGDGMITNGTININKMKEKMRVMIRIDALAMNHTLEKCNNEIERSLPECDYADTVMRCIIRNMELEKAKHLTELAAHQNKIRRNCKAEYNITEEQFNNHRQDVMANRTCSPNMKCFLNCLLTDLMKNGTFDMNKMKETMVGMSPFEVLAMNHSLEKCSKEVPRSLPECDYADTVIHCIIRKSELEKVRLGSINSTTESQAKD